MEGRASLSKRALPLIRQFPDGVFRELMFQALAERTGLELASLMRLEVPPPDLPPPPPAPPDDPWTDEAPPPAGDELFPPPEDVDAGPRQRPPLSHTPTAHATLAQAAIALLLHKPSIASRCEPGALEDLPGAEGALLRDVIELLHKRPESSTGMLLGHWHGSSEGDLLARLAGQERLIPSDGIEAQFEDIIRRLSTLPLRQRITEEIGALKSGPYGQMTTEEKTRLRELLRALRDLDSRSGPGTTP